MFTGCYAEYMELSPCKIDDLLERDKELVITNSCQIFKAKPSHVLIGANLFAKFANVNIQLALETPFKTPDYGFNQFDFYCKQMEVVFVWEFGYWGSLTPKTRQVLCRLRRRNIYKGTIGEIGQYRKFNYNKIG